MNCNEVNAHPRDAGIRFDAPSHSYFLTSDGRELRSVSSIIEESFPKFDAPYWAARKAMRRGCDPQVILDEWEAEAEKSRRLGTEMHARIEDYYLRLSEGLGCDLDSPECREDTDAFRLFGMFASVCRLHPFRTEWRIYDEELGVAGTLDFLELTPEGSFVIYDWKRSRKLVNGYGQLTYSSPFHAKAVHPAIAHLDDTSYWHYTLQLSIYRYILERRYGIRVSSQKLGVFHPAYSRPYVLTLHYLRDEVEKLLRDC